MDHDTLELPRSSAARGVVSTVGTDLDAWEPLTLKKHHVRIIRIPERHRPTLGLGLRCTDSTGAPKGRSDTSQRIQQERQKEDPLPSTGARRAPEGRIQDIVQEFPKKGSPFNTSAHEGRI